MPVLRTVPAYAVLHSVSAYAVLHSVSVYARAWLSLSLTFFIHRKKTGTI